jgi:hypothetical protein
VAETATTDIAVVRDVSLSELMGRASLAVANAFRGAEWVRVEVVNVQVRSREPCLRRDRLRRVPKLVSMLA